MELKSFIDLVAQMRTSQREYFRKRQSHLLSESKRLEAEVDRAIEEFRGQQGTLFKGGTGDEPRL